MIFHPVNYFRDVRHDFPFRFDHHVVDKCRSVALAAFPLISLYQPLRTPLTRGLGCVRAVSHLCQAWQEGKENNRVELAYHLFQSCVSVSVVALSIINPAFGMAVSSVSDIIANAKECISYLHAGEYQKSLEPFARLVLSSLFLGTVCYGSIELTVATFALQIVLGCYESIGHFRHGELLEGLLKALTVGVHMHQTIPQAKLLYWKWSYKPVLEGTLRQDEKGFVYLDVPDEYVKNLYELFGDSNSELPPYFAPGKAGAHVSIVLKSEMQQAGGLKISEIGQKFTFRIANVGSVKPTDFAGIEKVWFLSLACPEMEILRTKYGFTPRLHDNHDFHLTFAVQRENKKV